MTEYIIEIESFLTVAAAKAWALRNMKIPKGNIPTVNIVSRDITVIEVKEV